MERLTSIEPVFVEFIPEQMEHGKLYISLKYQVANHLCACGCGNQTVTPLNNKGWVLHYSKMVATLAPSIGNFSYPCKSHYFIVNNKINWL